ncbi:hypothetical protein MMC27_001588 [Xylographa pallens]|nr:hypothetical protein [Xylographa pallens]
MNSARVFGGRVPGDISGLVESYVPGAASILPVLYSLAGFNFIGYIWQNMIQAFVSFFLVSVSILATDSLCGEVLEWLTVNVATRRGLGAVSLNASKAQIKGNVRPTFPNASVQYEPASQSSFWFMRGWRLIYSRRQVIPVDTVQYGHMPEDGQAKAAGLVLTTFGFSPNFLKAFLEECSEAAVRKAKTVTTFHKYSEGIETFKAIKRPTRPLRTIDLDLQTKEQLVEDIQRYLQPASVRFYATRGIPHRRGYLFHGPPGTGKTSMSVALAGHFRLDLYIINLAAFTKGDAVLADTFETIPRKCIVLLEDIDSAGIKRENIRQEIGLESKSRTQGKAQKAPKVRNSITLSGLLNAIDGATSQEGRVLIMTTNDPEALDDALIRPGRIDMQIFFGPVSQRVAEQIFVRMYTRDTRDSALPDTGVGLLSKHQSLVGKLLTNLRFFSWWRVLTLWALPPTWAAFALRHLFGLEIVVSKLLLGVGIYTATVMVLLCSLAISVEESVPTTIVSAMPPNSQLLTEPAVRNSSPMTKIEREELQEMARVFGSRIPENRFTPAEVQGFLIMNMEDPAAALAGIDDWVARLLAAKDRGTNIIPREDFGEFTPKPNVGQVTTPPNSGNNQHEPPMTAVQSTDPSDQNVVFLEGSPSSHIFPSATRGYKKLTAYFCYSPKGAATSLQEKQRQHNTVQYFQQASKALEAIDGKEVIPSSRYQLSRSITSSPTKDNPDSGPSGVQNEDLAGLDENVEMAETEVTADDTLSDQDEDDNGITGSPHSRVGDILLRRQSRTAHRGTRGGVMPARLNYTRHRGSSSAQPNARDEGDY